MEKKKLHLVEKMLDRIEIEEIGILANLESSTDYNEFEDIINRLASEKVVEKDIERLKEMGAFACVWCILREIRYGLIQTESEVDNKIDKYKAIISLLK